MTDDELHEQLAQALEEHQFEFSVDRCAWLCASCKPPMPIHNDALRHQADTLMPAIREHVAKAELRADARARIEEIKLRERVHIVLDDAHEVIDAGGLRRERYISADRVRAALDRPVPTDD